MFIFIFLFMFAFVKENGDEDLQVLFVSKSKKKLAADKLQQFKLEQGLDTSSDAHTSKLGVGACNDIEKSECKATPVTYMQLASHVVGSEETDLWGNLFVFLACV